MMVLPLYVYMPTVNCIKTFMMLKFMFFNQDAYPTLLVLVCMWMKSVCANWT